MNLLLSTLLLTLGIQLLFFIFAAAFKTDKVTDLSYGLTFIIITVDMAVTAERGGMFSVLLTCMVVLWGLRLATYLFIRILKIGKDDRFDGIRERFWSFAKFWALQGIAIWVILLPTILGMERQGSMSVISWFGAGIWLLGLVIETIADWQKFTFKNDTRNRGKWIESGLWKYSRHPNYFGELLIWWGIFLYVLPVFSGLDFIAGVVGPLSITVLLLFFTGIPTLAKKMKEKHGKDIKFQQYLKRTRLLIPLPNLVSQDI